MINSAKPASNKKPNLRTGNQPKAKTPGNPGKPCSGYYLEVSGELVPWCKVHNRMSVVCEQLAAGGLE